MFILNVPYVGEYQATYETWIGSGEEHGPSNNQAGADFTTNFAGGGTSYHYASNSFTGQSSAFNSDTVMELREAETDNGSVFQIQNRTLTYLFESFSGAIERHGGTDGDGTGTGYEFTIISHANFVNGAWPEFHWNQYHFTHYHLEQGVTNSTTTSNTVQDQTSEQTASGSGDMPPGGVGVPYTVATTTEWGGNITRDATTQMSVYTGTISTRGSGTATYTVPTTTTVNYAFDVTTGTQTTVEVSRAVQTSSAFFDPDNFYTIALVLIPQKDIGIEDWLWLYHPGADVPDKATFFYTDLYHSVEGDQNFAIPPRFFYQYVMPQIDGEQDFVSWTNTFEILATFSDTDQYEFYTSVGNSTSTSSDTFNSEVDTFNVSSTLTLSAYYPGQLPMSLFTWTDTVVLTSAVKNAIPAYTTTSASNEDWATMTIATHSRISFTTLTNYIWFRESDGRMTSSSYSYPVDSFTITQVTTYDGDVYITDYATYAYGAGHAGHGFNMDVGDMTITRSIDTLFDAVQYPNYLLGQSAFKPVLTRGYQIQPRIDRTNPVYSGVGANAPVSQFPQNFFTDVFVEAYYGAVQAPYGFFYQDETGGITGTSAYGDYTFSFGSDVSNVGQIFVTHRLFDTVSETFTVFLDALGDTVQTEVTAGFGALDYYGERSIAGGSPNAGGFQTVVLNGFYKTTDNDRGSGTDLFDGNSFQMATDELSVFEQTRAAQVIVGYGGGGNFILLDVYQAHTDMLSPGMNPV